MCVLRSQQAVTEGVLGALKRACRGCQHCLHGAQAFLQALKMHDLGIWNRHLQDNEECPPWQQRLAQALHGALISCAHFKLGQSSVLVAQWLKARGQLGQLHCKGLVERHVLRELHTADASVHAGGHQAPEQRTAVTCARSTGTRFRAAMLLWKWACRSASSRAALVCSSPENLDDHASQWLISVCAPQSDES